MWEEKMKIFLKVEPDYVIGNQKLFYSFIQIALHKIIDFIETMLIKRRILSNLNKKAVFYLT